MNQRSFSRMKDLIEETSEAYNYVNDNGGHLNCDLAHYIARRAEEVGGEFEDAAALTPEKLAGFIRRADRLTPLSSDAKYWAEHVVDYIEKEVSE